MTNFLFTSESVAEGHPDKLCDQISDAIVDACLAQDAFSHVACESVAASGLLMIAGEITSTAEVDYQQIARKTIKSIGYTDCRLGFDYRSCGVIVCISKQSPDISRGIHDQIGDPKTHGAGDQGIMFGYASDETEEFMPMPISLANKLVRALKSYREEKTLPFLRPDGKAQITLEYNQKWEPIRIHSVVLSAQHEEKVSHKEVCEGLQKLIKEQLPPHLLDRKTRYYLNPTGRFVIGGPVGDCGLTGRKTIVDTYGGMGHHGGGAFSGKDPTKVDRSGSYAARYVAKNIVAAGLAKRCEVQISYAIGVSHPISLKVETFGTASVPEEQLTEAIPHVFDLTPGGIIETLNLRRPIYQATAFGGHFGRTDLHFPWEAVDQIDQLLKTLEKGRTKSVYSKKAT